MSLYSCGICGDLLVIFASTVILDSAHTTFPCNIYLIHD